MLLVTLALSAAQSDFTGPSPVTNLVPGPEAIAVGDLTPAPGNEIVVSVPPPNEGFRIVERDPVSGAWCDVPVAIDGGPVSASWIEIADVDADGRNDVVCLGYPGGVLFNDTPAGAPRPRFSWSPWVPHLGSAGTTLAGWGDINGDGLTDLVFGRRLNGPFGTGFVLQVAPRTFSPAFPLPPATQDVVGASDLDGDGDLDLVALVGNDALRVYDNVGGTWSETWSQPWPHFAGALVVDDLNGDGVPDIVALEFDRIRVLRGDGSGAFTVESDITADIEPLLADLVDVDGDGDRDLVLRADVGPHWATFRAHWVERVDTFEFAGVPEFVIPGAPHSAEARVTDLDGDGTTDVVTSTIAGPPRIHFGERDAQGSITYPLPGLEPAFGPLRVTQVCATDLDADGDLDLVTADRDGLWLTEQRAAGVYHDVLRIPARLPLESPAVIADGATLAGVDSAGRLFAVDRATPHAPTSPQVLAAGIATHDGAIAFVDPDGDEDADVVALHANGEELVLVENLGGATWASPTTIAIAPSGTTLRSVTAGDWNGDGRGDLVVHETSASGEALRALLAIGGVLTPSPTTAPVDAPPTRVRGARTLVGDAQQVVALVGDEVARWEVDPQVALTPLQALAQGLTGALDFDIGPETRTPGPTDRVLRVLEFRNVRIFKGAGVLSYLEFPGRVGAPGVAQRVLGIDVDGFGAVETLVWPDLQGELAWAPDPQQQRRSVEYCHQPITNAVGLAAELRAHSNRRPAFNVQPDALALHIDAFGLPPGATGLLLVAPLAAHVPAGNGTLCLGGTIGRFDRPGEVFTVGAGGAYGRDVDAGNLPQGVQTAVGAAGETWCFQAWYRDGGTSRFTSAVAAQL